MTCGPGPTAPGADGADEEAWVSAAEFSAASDFFLLQPQIARAKASRPVKVNDVAPLCRDGMNARLICAKKFIQ
jgi:hypothetical protein